MSLLRETAIALFIAVLAAAPAGCVRSDDIALVPVPITPGAPPTLDRSPSPGGHPQNADLPPGHPPIPSSAGAMPAPVAQEGDMTWTAPESWVAESPSGDMRLAQWRVPGEGADEDAECALFRFPGGGGIEQNIDRWLGQFEQPDDSDSAARAERQVFSSGPVEVHTVAVSGTYVTRGPSMTGEEVRQPGWALFGAIFTNTQRPGGSLRFLKCTGPQATMRGQAQAIGRFVASVVL